MRPEIYCNPSSCICYVCWLVLLFVLCLGIVKDLCFCCVTYFFIIFFFVRPYISEPANGRLMGCYKHGYGVILISRDWILRQFFFASSPYFRGNGEFAPNFAKHFKMPSFGELSEPNSATCENGKIFFQKRGIIVLHFIEKYASLPLPILVNCGWRVCLLWSITQ